MSYREEFPDYDNAAAADAILAAGFSDQSWRLDACPSFARCGVEIWADYAAPELREFPDAPQFRVYHPESGLCETFDDVAAAIAAICA